MNELLRDAIKWLIGGGALALATLAGTTAYQNGQLEIEREKNLRLFLDKYVELALKGTLDERIRFVSYWESLQVKDKIGVDFALYRAALQNEIQTGIADTRAQVATTEVGPRRPSPSSPSPPTAGPRPPTAAAPPLRTGDRPVAPPSNGSPPDDRIAANSPVQQRLPSQQQQAYYEVRQTSVDKLAVPSLERAGFQALLDRKADVALENFVRARDLWPDYHNLKEIAALLQASIEKLRDGDAEAWRNTYRKIVSSYAWGLPNDLMPPFQKAASG